MVTCGRCRVKADAEQYRLSQDDAVTPMTAVGVVLKIELGRTVDKESARLAIAGSLYTGGFEWGE